MTGCWVMAGCESMAVLKNAVTPATAGVHGGMDFRLRRNDGVRLAGLG